MNKRKVTSPLLFLKEADPILGGVIERYPSPEFRPSSNYFQSLVESIISQQLSIKAADTITARFVRIFSPVSTFPTPEEVLDVKTEVVRAAGISYAKISYIRDLAEKVSTKTIVLQKLAQMEDEEAIEYLIQVKGIGRWTAEMFLMFSLGREDVFSYGDQGIKNAMKKLYKFKKHPTPKQAEKISNTWKPYRTWACRYLWASLDNSV